MSLPKAAVSSDIDTLYDIYKGQGCRRKGGYTYEELEIGLFNFSRFLDEFNIKATLFMVGQDFEHPQNHSAIRSMISSGHEIANHSYSHPQGFRYLSPETQSKEIADMEKIAQETVGAHPVGFRSPGWNISDRTLPILRKRGYLYDSSVFPTSLMPILKFMHWYTMSSRSGPDRTTMGHLYYMLAPIVPYRTHRSALGLKGHNDFVEFPISVMPILRIPFFATFLFATGLPLFKFIYSTLRGNPIQFMFHLSDFVDYNTPSLIEQVPRDSDGLYIPQALRMPLETKLGLLRQAIQMISMDYEFTTLKNWAREYQSNATN